MLIFFVCLNICVILTYLNNKNCKKEVTILGKFFEKNLSFVLLAMTGYFLFSISSSLKETAEYHSDVRACAKMKAFSSNKDSSKLYQQKASLISGVEIKYIAEYCKKLTLQNIFWRGKKKVLQRFLS